MAEHWITTRKALEIAKDADALLVRLRTGRLKAKADVLIWDGQSKDRVAVPARFWDHDVYYEPHFDWHRGDFVNGIDGFQEIKAIGVSIDAGDLLDMVPFERRGLVARSLSVTGDPEWLSAQEAKRLVQNANRANLMIAGGLIIEQARLGFVVARAVIATCERHGDLNEWTWQRREWDVPATFWGEFIEGRNSVQDWSMGLFSGSGRLDSSICTLTLSGAHFHRPSLEAFLGLPEDEGDSEQEGGKRGRRPKYDWPWAVSAVWWQLNRGELIPETQADVEKAMIAVLKTNKEEPGESTVRPYASIVFEDYMRS